jgi:hypothetical protein
VKLERTPVFDRGLRASDPPLNTNYLVEDRTGTAVAAPNRRDTDSIVETFPLKICFLTRNWPKTGLTDPRLDRRSSGVELGQPDHLLR